MLLSLDITNYALIDRLRMDFSEGFTVITGETGAGKSIILDALNLLLGQRADVKAIRNGEKKCVIEGRFGISSFSLKDFFDANDLDYDDETILRREVYDTGKSRAFVNDVPVSLSLMKELGSKLIDIHSQNQNQQLSNEEFQLAVLDTVAADDAELQLFKQLYGKWKQSDRELRALKERVEANKADQEYLTYQLSELEDAKLQSGEQEELEQEEETLSHAEEIKESLYKAGRLFSSDDRGILSDLKECCDLLRNIEEVFPPCKELYERLDSSLIELKDISYEVESQEDSVEYNPDRLQKVSDRLNEIYSLQQKHHVSTVDELISLEEELSDKLSEITSADDRIAELEQHTQKQYDAMEQQARLLSQKRRQASGEMQQTIVSSLVSLGMPNVRFEAEVSPRKDIGPLGADSVRFLFSANKSSRLQDLSQVASGGEISRVMLAVKALLARSRQLPTIVFDEIDTGVSGEIAARMANVMDEMSRNMSQVICITHLPQIAAKGKTHFRVYKEDTDSGTVSRITKLSPEARVDEIAHMLSGTAITDAALNNAKALLNNE